MNETPFFKTRMGHRFYEHTVPELVRQLEQIADRLPSVQRAKQPEVDELLLATYGLINAVEAVMDTEIVPGSEATQQAFRNLRARAQTARQAADAAR